MSSAQGPMSKISEQRAQHINFLRTLAEARSQKYSSCFLNKDAPINTTCMILEYI